MSLLTLTTGENSPVSALTVTIAPSAFEIRETAIDFAKSVFEVTNDTEEKLAVEALRELKALSKGVETTRTQLKAPILDAGRNLDSAAKTFLGPVAAEEVRLQQMLNRFAADKAEAARKLEAERQKELQRIERERLAEEDRIRKEAEKAVEAAPTFVEAMQAQKTAEARIEAAQVNAAAMAPSVPVVATRAEGSSVQQPWTFEVEDIAALYKARPELCSITPKRAEILTLIRAGTREIPGLKIRQETKVVVR